MSRPPRPYRDECWGILNHEGGIWTPENFRTEALAQAHLDAAREEWGRNRWGDLSRHRVAKMRLTLSLHPKERDHD